MDEKRLSVRHFSDLPRLGRPPEVYLGGPAGDQVHFILGLLPETRLPFGKRDYFLELLLLWEPVESVTTALVRAVDMLAQDLGADNFLTPFLRDDAPEIAVLEAAGFAVQRRQHQFRLTREDALTGFIPALRRMARWGGRGMDIRPYTDLPPDATAELHLDRLGMLPDGHYVLSGELPPRERDYSLSRAAVLDGVCCGAVVAGLSGNELVIETILTAGPGRASPATGLLLLSAIEAALDRGAESACFRIAEDNDPPLRLVRSTGAAVERDWLRLRRHGQKRP